MLRRNRTIMDSTMRSLLRERLQTSIDGVVRGGECSRSVANTNSLLSSRAGVLALICWLAAYSCSAPAPSHRPAITRSKQSRPDASRQVFSLVAASARPIQTTHRVTSVPRKAAVLRSVHTSARPRSAHHLPITSQNTGSLSAKTTHEVYSTAQRASLSSLSHPHPRSNHWLDRLSSTLSSLLGTSEQRSEREKSHSDAPPQGRHHRSRNVGRIHSVMQDPQIYDPIVLPRHPIVLCHGLYGFDVRGPFLGLEIHYWAKTLDILRKKMGVEVLVHGVPPTGSIKERAESLHEFLLSDEAGVRGKKLNFVAHSMGGLDVRHLLTHIRPQPEDYVPVSLTTVSTPHRGSPFMDWCNANIGIGNDYIEQAIKEARAERAHLADRDTYGPARTTTKVPYSLKSPLFTRPRPLDGSSSLAKKSLRSGKAEDIQRPASDNEFSTEALFSAASSVVDSLTPDGKSNDTAAEKVKQAVKQGSKNDGSLPFGLSSFIGSLSTLTGSFSSYMLSLLDTPAYAMLSTKYMNEVFNPKTPNVDGVKYYSVASRTPSLAIWHPLWLPKLILDAAAESRTAGGEIDGSADALGGADQGNDGLVSVESAKWGEFLGVMEGCDHWDLRGGGAPRWKQNINPSTGRPYPNKVSGSGEAVAAAAGAKQSEGPSSSSWSDINRLLFSKATDGADSNEKPMTAFRSFKELAESEGWNGVSLRDPDTAEEAGDAVESSKDDDGENPAFSSFHPQHEDDTLVHEIASWISDRLPSGNAERRAMAQERDKLIKQSGLTSYNPQNTSVQDSVNGGRNESVDSGATTKGLTDFSTDARSRSSVTPASASFSTQQVASAASAAISHVVGKQDIDESQRGAEKMESKSRSNKEIPELERFWIALCRHLHNEGL